MFNTGENRKQTLDNDDIAMQIIEYYHKHVACMVAGKGTIYFNLEGKWCTVDDPQN